MSSLRLEVKYLLDRGQARAFLELARRWMRPDRHSRRSDEAASYEVRTLYYDTPGLRHYRDVVAGEGVRRKVRLRRYGLGEGPLFFEVKERRGRSVFKDRQPVDRAGLEDFLRDPAARRFPGPCGAYALDFCREPHFPVLAVVYDRIALEDIVGSGFRITLDKNLRYSRPALFDRPVAPDDPRALPPDLLVLELKFRHGLPSWVAEAVRSLELSPGTCSKYAMSVRRGIDENPLFLEAPLRWMS